MGAVTALGTSSGQGGALLVLQLLLGVQVLCFRRGNLRH